VERHRIPLWILPLIFILTIWNPATLALQAASSVWNIGARSTLSLVFLAARLIIISIGVAAGVALWLRRPGAVWLAKFSSPNLSSRPRGLWPRIAIPTR